MKFAARLLSIAWVLSLQVSCATSARSDGSALDSELTRVTELTDVPFFSDNTTLCGPASLAAVLNFAGVATNLDVLAPSVYLPGRQGALQIEMLSAARRAGAVAYVLPADQDTLMASLKAGYPVVVLLNLGLSFAPSWHYAVVVGVEQVGQNRQFILRSGEQRRQRMPAYTFNKTWERSRNWAMIVSSPERIPDFLPQPALIDALVKFERSAPGDLAVTAYSTALAAGLKNSVLQMGLANALEKRGDQDEAMEIWRGLLREEQNLPAGVNLAFALNKQGKTVEAVAIACSLLQLGNQAEVAPALRVLLKENLTALIVSTGGKCTP